MSLLQVSLNIKQQMHVFSRLVVTSLAEIFTELSMRIRSSNTKSCYPHETEEL